MQLRAIPINIRFGTKWDRNRSIRSSYVQWYTDCNTSVTHQPCNTQFSSAVTNRIDQQTQWNLNLIRRTNTFLKFDLKDTFKFRKVDRKKRSFNFQLYSYLFGILCVLLGNLHCGLSQSRLKTNYVFHINDVIIINICFFFYFILIQSVWNIFINV